ncbi:MAG: ATP-binding protein [Opitutaceae bacterium]
MNALPEIEMPSTDAQLRAMGRLVAAVQELSLTRDLESVIRIVRTVARELAGADGATFILRENGYCHYVDEDAIGPLWKGQRFPMSACVSGWAMLNRQPAVIPDIFDDPRVPVDAYRPTFVKSLVMVPIRTSAPIGAIGVYWAHQYRAGAHEVELLQTLSNTTAVALENVQVYRELEQRVAERTRELRAANEELEAFSYTVSHDLRGPLTAIGGFASLIENELAPHAEGNVLEHLAIIRKETIRMETLIKDLLQMAAATGAELHATEVDLSALASDFLEGLRAGAPERLVDFRLEPGVVVHGDSGLLRVALENLLANAWKYSSKRPRARIELGRERRPDGIDVIFVRDNGAGFDMRQADKLFTPFKRLHTSAEFPGTGIGLATVRRIVERHGGRVWADSEPGSSATFYFSLPRQGVAASETAG